MPRFSRVRFAAVSSVLVGVLALVPAFPASAIGTNSSGPSSSSPSSSSPSSYLALGDSVPFGYSPLLVRLGVNPGVFVGYPQLVSNLFTPRLTEFNASCPGETSTSLISGTRPDNGCQNFRLFVGALHVSYRGSQLQFAETFVAANPQTKFVSLTIGANDLLLLQDNCKATRLPKDVDACIMQRLPGLLGMVRTNLSTIYTGLRAAGFKGDFVAVTYYSSDYRDPLVTGAVEDVDGVLAEVTTAFGGKVADGFGTFAAAAAPFGGDTCKAGLLIRLTADRCDIHPSPAGAALLASAVHAVEGP